LVQYRIVVDADVAGSFAWRGQWLWRTSLKEDEVHALQFARHLPAVVSTVMSGADAYSKTRRKVGDMLE